MDEVNDDLRLNIEPIYSFLEFYQAPNDRKQFDELALKTRANIVIQR